MYSPVWIRGHKVPRPGRTMPRPFVKLLQKEEKAEWRQKQQELLEELGKV